MSHPFNIKGVSEFPPKTPIIGQKKAFKRLHSEFLSKITGDDFISCTIWGTWGTGKSRIKDELLSSFFDKQDQKFTTRGWYVEKHKKDLLTTEEEDVLNILPVVVRMRDVLEPQDSELRVERMGRHNIVNMALGVALANLLENNYRNEDMRESYRNVLPRKVRDRIKETFEKELKKYPDETLFGKTIEKTLSEVFGDDQESTLLLIIEEIETASEEAPEEIVEDVTETDVKNLFTALRERGDQDFDGKGFSVLTLATSHLRAHSVTGATERRFVDIDLNMALPQDVTKLSEFVSDEYGIEISKPLAHSVLNLAKGNMGWFNVFMAHLLTSCEKDLNLNLENAAKTIREHLIEPSFKDKLNPNRLTHFEEKTPSSISSFLCIGGPISTSEITGINEEKVLNIESGVAGESEPAKKLFYRFKELPKEERPSAWLPFLNEICEWVASEHGDYIELQDSKIPKGALGTFLDNFLNTGTEYFIPENFEEFYSRLKLFESIQDGLETMKEDFKAVHQGLRELCSNEELIGISLSAFNSMSNLHYPGRPYWIEDDNVNRKIVESRRELRNNQKSDFHQRITIGFGKALTNSSQIEVSDGIPYKTLWGRGKFIHGGEEIGLSEDFATVAFSEEFDSGEKSQFISSLNELASEGIKPIFCINLSEEDSPPIKNVKNTKYIDQHLLQLTIDYKNRPSLANFFVDYSFRFDDSLSRIPGLGKKLEGHINRPEAERRVASHLDQVNIYDDFKNWVNKLEAGGLIIRPLYEPSPGMDDKLRQFMEERFEPGATGGTKYTYEFRDSPFWDDSKSKLVFPKSVLKLILLLNKSDGASTEEILNKQFYYTGEGDKEDSVHQHQTFLRAAAILQGSKDSKWELITTESLKERYDSKRTALTDFIRRYDEVTNYVEDLPARIDSQKKNVEDLRDNMNTLDLNDQEFFEKCKVFLNHPEIIDKKIKKCLGNDEIEQLNEKFIEIVEERWKRVEDLRKKLEDPMEDGERINPPRNIELQDLDSKAQKMMDDYEKFSLPSRLEFIEELNEVIRSKVETASNKAEKILDNLEDYKEFPTEKIEKSMNAIIDDRIPEVKIEFNNNRFEAGKNKLIQIFNDVDEPIRKSYEEKPLSGENSDTGAYGRFKQAYKQWRDLNKEIDQNGKIHEKFSDFFNGWENEDIEKYKEDYDEIKDMIRNPEKVLANQEIEKYGELLDGLGNRLKAVSVYRDALLFIRCRELKRSFEENLSLLAYKKLCDRFEIKPIDLVPKVDYRESSYQELKAQLKSLDDEVKEEIVPKIQEHVSGDLDEDAAGVLWKDYLKVFEEYQETDDIPSCMEKNEKKCEKLIELGLADKTFEL